MFAKGKRKVLYVEKHELQLNWFLIDQARIFSMFKQASYFCLYLY